MPSKVQELPVNQIVPPWNMLRPVRETEVEYFEMMDSIREHGILKSLLVRPHPTRKRIYEIIDGMWRFSCAKSLDFSHVPCIIKVVEDEEEFLSLQIQANSVSYETRPIEFARQMQRMMRIRESVGAPMTMKELASIVGKSTTWVSQRLKLLTLCEDAQIRLKKGTLTLRKAIALSRLKKKQYQRQFLEVADKYNAPDFETKISKFIRKETSCSEMLRAEFRENHSIQPRLQSMDSLLMELDRMDNISQIIVKKGLTSAIEGARVTLEWVLNLHDSGRQEQVKEVRHRLSQKERMEILGRQRYEELEELRKLREERVGGSG